MPAPIGTVVTHDDPLLRIMFGVAPTFTKTGEGSWKHSHEDEPRSVSEGYPYDEAIQQLEEIVAGTYEGEDKDDYTFALPEGDAA